MRRVFVFVLLVVFVFPLLAENASNVRVQQKGYRGDTVVITYDLSKMSDVRLLMSTDMATLDCYVLSTKRAVFVAEVRDICYICMMS